MITRLQDLCADVTNADVLIEELSGGKLSVSVYWPETQWDRCHGQDTIVREALKVLSALESEGWVHCEFAGRKDLGHHGGGTHFAVRRATTTT